MHWPPLRVVQKRWKAVYLVLFVIASIEMGMVLDAMKATVVASIIANVFSLGAIYFATRIFRVKEELLLAPRPWWKLTGRPRAGFVLGAYGGAGLLLMPILMIVDPTYRFTFVDVIGSVVMSYLYFASSVRLRREARAATSTLAPVDSSKGVAQ
jgi:hypothetical protein